MQLASVTTSSLTLTISGMVTRSRAWHQVKGEVQGAVGALMSSSIQGKVPPFCCSHIRMAIYVHGVPTSIYNMYFFLRWFEPSR